MSSRHMKYCGALLVAAFASSPAAAISIASMDDFQTGTLEGWAPTTGALTVPANSGPAGIGDFSILIIAGNGQNLDISNSGAEWTGNYTAAGMTGIQADVRNVNGGGAFPVNLAARLRLSINGAGGAFSTDPAIILGASGPWTPSLLFSLATLTPIQDAAPAGGFVGFDLGATLAAVSEIRFVHNNQPAWRGAVTPNANQRGLRFDNIFAVGVPVPVPATLPLLLSAVAGLGVVARRKRA